MNFKYLLVSILMVGNIITYAQKYFLRWDSVLVLENNDTLKFPFAGGFDNPQLSDIDLNLDGIKDLFVFDRGSENTFTFINKGTPGQVDYSYDPKYRSLFPKFMYWVLLEDYDCDGKEDIFTYPGNRLEIYHNDYTTADGLHFTLNTTIPNTQLYITPTDLPAITDVDNDGLVDILTFSANGLQMLFYKNVSFINNQNCNKPEFILSDPYWGKFTESFGNCNVCLEVPCRISNPDYISETQHAGSTVLALDLDGDNDKEIIVGDVSCTNPYMLTNGGSPTTAYMDKYDSLYPLSYPVSIFRFPCGFYEDVNNDGKKDLLFAANGKNISENINCLWYYQNIGISTTPVFNFSSNAFLQSDMIDVGESSNPVFFDYNSDSLLDLVIGNYGYFSTSGNYTPGLALYENIGTKKKPVFVLITRDYAKLSKADYKGAYPSFGDLDGDGDMDMMVGDYIGFLHYFENTAGIGNITNFVLKKARYKNIDVGQFATPQLVDVNGDKKLDLLVGERSGTINFFENKGSLQSFDFDTLPTNANFGGIDVMKACCTGFSSPFLTHIFSDGKLSLLVGTESGYIHHYTDIEGNLNGNFTLVDSMFESINEGQRSSISGADINGDSAIDLLIGNQGGGLSLYKNIGDSIPDIKPPIDTLPFSINVYPNPVSKILTINITGLFSDDKALITITNLLGQTVYVNHFNATFNKWEIPFPVNKVNDGIYFMRVSIENRPDLIIQKLPYKILVVGY